MFLDIGTDIELEKFPSYGQLYHTHSIGKEEWTDAGLHEIHADIINFVANCRVYAEPEDYWLAECLEIEVIFIGIVDAVYTEEHNISKDKNHLNYDVHIL